MQGDVSTPERRFVENLRSLRRARGWSQEKLVKEVENRTALRLNATVVTKLEWALDPSRASKARGLGLNEALAFATTLNVELSDLIRAPEEAADTFADPLREELSKAQRDLAEARETLVAIAGTFVQRTLWETTNPTPEQLRLAWEMQGVLHATDTNEEGK